MASAINILDQFPKRRLFLSEEIALAERIAKGDKNALNELVIANMREAILYTRRTSNSALSDDILASLCYQGLMRNAKRFKSCGTRFFAFSKPGLRGEIKDYWRTLDPIRGAKCIPIDVIDHDRPKDTESERSQNSEEDAGQSKPVYREATTGEICQPETDEIEARDSWRAIRGKVWPSLTEHERMILTLRHVSGLNFSEIAGLLGTSKSAAHSVYTKTIYKMRRLLLGDKGLLEERE